MSIHKLTAGSGYDYLTRQVAALDATDKGHTTLASYYTQRGETPGVWVGSGLTGIDGLQLGDVVTQEQMLSLFGSGHHPLAQQRRDHLEGPDLTDADVRRVTRLGQPFKIQTGITPFRKAVAERVAAANQAAGLPGDWPLPASERAAIRTQVGREFFAAEHRRDPLDARELSGFIARASRPAATTVAGFDLTFSPVKSVSTLWAIADPPVAAAIERAHRAAIADALAFLEGHALYTRTGASGVRQVDVQGLVATAFTHRDSRAGDPDLHTHVAVANKVQTLDGRWLAIDGRVLFKAHVTASETYNTALERHLTAALGVTFTERPATTPGARPVREITGVDPALNARWSVRRAAIVARRAELAAAFQVDHGRPPTPIEAIHLAQQATLETRDAKHEPRTLAEQRATWRAQAEQVLGGPDRVAAMIQTALTPARSGAGVVVDGAFVDATAQRVVEVLMGHRATWQVWHVRAEAHRQLRPTTLPTGTSERVVTAVVDRVLQTLSVALVAPDTGIEEPVELRRTDGTSMYDVAGATLYTAPPVLAAEERLVTAAARTDGHRIGDTAVDLALLEATANGLTLNAGQADLVRQMATSGARIQLAIAPAGSGKTTAMRALATAWTTTGGTILGLAPSAAAASALADEAGIPTDTLAQLTTGLAHGHLPQWAHHVDKETLLVIDEAGMADTITLDTVVDFALTHGASVRLIGDTQQLAAIGAGGVLRDIATTHGALHLNELLRFADPAEAAASLALRDGRPDALGFYLDTGRVHVGDQTTLLDQVFTAWTTDRVAGRDALMVAPTRELVVQLNHRARTHRLSTLANDGSDSRTVVLADGNPAGPGDVILTRSNDRRLRLSATDWVKNGDRWTVLQVHDNQSLTVAHARTGRRITLPADYVTASTQLGYASTIHTAQGVTADTLHGLITGTESRQQLYTMLTRGRSENHVYVQVVGDGDPHTTIHPDTTHPRTATDVLEAVLARDDAPRSATTTRADAHDPATLLADATARYVDALTAAAEDLLGPVACEWIEVLAEQTVPGVTEAPAWPVLRSHLLQLAADGTQPITALRQVATLGASLQDAADVAAVLDWRLHTTHPTTTPGPLPWLPPIPAHAQADPHWGTYLFQRSRLVAGAADVLREQTLDNPVLPEWARHLPRPADDVLADIQVWRAATATPATDLHPTGQAATNQPAAAWQHQLTRRVHGTRTPAWQEWGNILTATLGTAASDDFAPMLADRLAAVSRAGINAATLLTACAAEGVLPDDHPAAALWWRVTRHLTPATAADTTALGVSPDWRRQLPDVLGDDQYVALQGSPAWPTLIATLEHGLHRGWTLENLLTPSAGVALGEGDDPCEALVWRICLLTDPLPDHNGLLVDDPADDRPHDLDELHAVVGVPADAPTTVPDPTWTPTPTEDLLGREAADDLVPEDELAPAAALRLAAIARENADPPGPTDAEIERAVRWAADWDDCPFTPARMVEINDLTAAYYQHAYTHSWAREYLTDRLRADVTGDPWIRPGYAPAGWDHLVNHLRRHGVTDEELLTTGVASTARTGRLIDRFRDRLVLPITHNGRVLGFVARRHPQLRDSDGHGPKYLNTPDTPLFHKGAQLYSPINPRLLAQATPVLVEGPLDAIAVTLAGHGRYAGLATLGTALTDEHATQLGTLPRDVIIATDHDPAGEGAAWRAFWALTSLGHDPRHAHLPAGSDPAEVHVLGSGALFKALEDAPPYGDELQRAVFHQPLTPESYTLALRVIATRPPHHWAGGLAVLSRVSRTPSDVVRSDLLAAALIAARRRDATPDRLPLEPSMDLGAARQRPPVSPRSSHAPRMTPEPLRPSALSR